MGPIRFLIAGAAALVALVLSIPVVLIGLPFWAVGGITRGIGTLLRKLQPREVAWTDLIEFVPEIGWKNRANVRAAVRGVRTFRVTTDAEGWRGKVPLDESELVLFGDSFAFGHGIDDRGFFADRVSSPRIKALGVNGYNLVQELLWMERLSERLRGKSVGWLVFYGNDLMDNLHPNVLHYRNPFVRKADSGWEIVKSHVSRERFPFDPRWGYGNKIAETCTPGFHSDRAYSAFAFLADRAAGICRAAGARFGVIGIPDVEMLDPASHGRLREKSSNPEAFDPSLPDRRLGAICGERGIPFLRLSEVLDVDDHLANDCHWTSRGHERVARAVERFYAEALQPEPASEARSRPGVRQEAVPAARPPIPEPRNA